MTNHHHWFRSGSYCLLGHLDMPDGQPVRSGVVIIPPFGWENICSYRRLRSLARTLASQGIAVLRFDLPGTGDSSGTALDPDLFAAWIRSVDDAVAEMKALSGVQTVSVLGIRLGALLALGAAVSAGTQIENLILWGASATGHAVWRELQAFRNLEVTEHTEGQAPPPQPVPGLEVAGFLLNPETENSLRGFDVTKFPSLQNQSVLLLSRDSYPQDRKLVQYLERGSSRVTLSSGMGYQKMMAEPHEFFALPPETEKTIIDFLQKHMEPGQTISASGREKLREERSCPLEPGIVENVYYHPYRGGSLFSILTMPASRRPSEWGLLFLNAGGVRHIGPNRMWVEASRRWAAYGIPAIRLDFLRVGESDCEEAASIEYLHSEDLTDQLGQVIKNLQSKLNTRRFIAVGLCSGAYVAFQTLLRNPAIRGAVLLNPRHFFWDPAVAIRRFEKRIGTGLVDVSDWRRLARGEFRPERIRQAARLALRRLLLRRSGADHTPPTAAQALEQGWSEIRQSQTRVALVFADGEPLLEEMEQAQQLPSATDPFISCIRVGKVGHTFRAVWAQQMLHDLMDREIQLTMGEDSRRELSA